MVTLADWQTKNLVLKLDLKGSSVKARFVLHNEWHLLNCYCSFSSPHKPCSYVESLINRVCRGHVDY